MFRTRLPVASSRIATGLLPLDLHVLSPPLAFILSQDQTLHCKCCLMLTLLTSQKINVSNRMYFAWLTYWSRPDNYRNAGCCCFPTFKDLLAIKCHPFYWECKGNGRSIYHQKYLPDFPAFAVNFNLFCKNWSNFFQRIAKIRPRNGWTNSFNLILFTFVPNIFTNNVLPLPVKNFIIARNNWQETQHWQGIIHEPVLQSWPVYNRGLLL